jgi:hypothetical protein
MPSADCPAWHQTLVCDACGGDAELRQSCQACRGRGLLMLSDCPRNLRTEAARRTLEMYQHARDGAWPVTGGVLDQTRSFLQAYRLLRSILPE